MRTKAKPTTLPLGVVSEGTLRTEDLLGAFLGALDGIRLTRDEWQTVRNVRHAIATADDAHWTSGDADVDLDDITTIMEAHCPDFCLFGAHDGDGALFGVWVDQDGLADAVRDGDVVRVADAAELSTVDRAFTLALLVNDHGNQTLFKQGGSRAWREVWSCV